MAKIKGVDKVLKSLKKFGKQAELMVEQTTSSNVDELVTNAKIYAPKDLGKLAQSIHKKENSKLSYSAVVGVIYAPYIEFGTGTKVNLNYLKNAGIPESYAMKFKGKGIKQVNLQPRPYLYPAFLNQRKQYIKDLKSDLKTLTNKYNG